MKTETIAAMTAAATTVASTRCAAALATLATGKRVFVKGKPVMQPWGDEKRAELKRLQSFDATDYAVQSKVATIVDGFVTAEGATTEEAGEALLADAVALYCAAGNAAVDAAFAQAVA